jgi:hypothetical protein
LALGLYVSFMGFTFCDGFKVHNLKKVLWYIVFLAATFYTVRIKKEFDLAFILPIPTLFAILLAVHERLRRKKAD